MKHHTKWYKRELSWSSKVIPYN